MVNTLRIEHCVGHGGDVRVAHGCKDIAVVGEEAVVGLVGGVESFGMESVYAESAVERVCELVVTSTAIVVFPESHIVSACIEHYAITASTSRIPYTRYASYLMVIHVQSAGHRETSVPSQIVGVEVVRYLVYGGKVGLVCIELLLVLTSHEAVVPGGGGVEEGEKTSMWLP